MTHTRHIIIIMTMMLTACAGKGEQDAETETADSAAAVTAADSAAIDTMSIDGVTSATYKANAPTFNGLITAAPDRSSATVSMTMGGRIHALKVMQGHSVAKGQTVALLDNPDFVTLQQEYIETGIQLEYLAKEYARQKSLGSQEAASQKRVQQSKAEFLTVKNRQEAYATQLKALGINPATVQMGNIRAYLPVRSPIAGYVTDINVNIGKYVDVGQPVCSVVNKSQLLVQLTVFERDINIISVGDRIDFRVNGMGKQIFSAKVVSIDQAVSKEDYSIKVYARILTPESSFRPGMYVRAKVRK